MTQILLLLLLPSPNTLNRKIFGLLPVLIIDTLSINKVRHTRCLTLLALGPNRQKRDKAQTQRRTRNTKPKCTVVRLGRRLKSRSSRGLRVV